MMFDLTNIPAQIWWLLAAVAVPAALLSGYRLLIIERQEHAQHLRLEGFRGEIRLDMQAGGVSWYHRVGELLAPIVGVVEQQRLRRSLAQAGINGHGRLATFISIKGLTAVSFVALIWAVHVFASVILFRVGAFGVAFLVGWRLPDLILNHLIKRRRLRLEQGMPDAIDLLVVCAEAGLSLNQAIEEISRQLRLSNRDVADEFTTTSAEMRILPDFGQALDNLVERTGLTQLAGLIGTLKQSIKYGTSLAESLRLIAGEMRAERHARIEERAARLPVLLAIPMMIFILPCLFMIIGTPVALRMMDVFKNITIGAP